jgi:hypothetical protein
MLFKDEQIALPAASGWSRCGSVAAALVEAGLPPVTTRYLGDMFSAEQWKTAEAATAALRKHFSMLASPMRRHTGCCWCPIPPSLTPVGP